nr:hypothetical protein [Candidatus Njordarchaeota archaeon]
MPEEEIRKILDKMSARDLKKLVKLVEDIKKLDDERKAQEEKIKAMEEEIKSLQADIENLEKQKRILSEKLSPDG